MTTGTLVPMFAALGDETRWSILEALGEGDASASALAGRLPVTRQAIAKHLAVLQEVGLVEPLRVGREVRYRVIGAQLSATAQRLDAIGAEWDRRLAAIKRIADQNRSFAAKAEGAKAENGDRVTVAFKGSIDGVPFEGGTGENIPVVIGSDTFIPGFEDQLTGIASGETRTIKATFPKNYMNAELAGKDAEFETTASLIEAPQDTKIDDEFAKSLGLESLDKLKEAARERLVAEFAGATRQRVKRSLLDRLDESHKFDAPPSLVDEEFNLMWNSIKAEMESSNKTFADENTTEDAAKEEYRKIADRRVRLGLVLSEIGEKNKITVTDDEVSRAVIERARQMPGREKEVWDFYRNNPNALAQLRAPIYEDKVVDFILELANVTEKKVTREDLYKDDEADKTAA